MKLPCPFYRLPLRFDAACLQEELQQFVESDWQRHPTGFAGNSAIRLISRNGAENDEFGSPMLPTSQLARMPYVRQVLSKFGVVWGRSRLMRLAPGAQVPEHTDINYHWFSRIRVHIPIVTNPAVSFRSGNAQVHMAAGEAWVFDNWANHSVHNGGEEDRVHLVADTCGTARFWHLVSQAQVGQFDRHPEPMPPMVPYVPGLDAPLALERVADHVVMPPAEMEQLVGDLLGDLATPRTPQEDLQRRQFASLSSSLCRDWRTLWMLFGASEEGWSEFKRLRDEVADELTKLEMTLSCASNGARVTQVMNSRVLLYAFVPPGERNAVSRRDVDRTVAKSAPSVLARPVERPVFIVAAPRSGSTLLFETLAQAPGVWTLGGEAHGLIERHPELQPSSPAVGSNRLEARHANEALLASICQDVAAGLRDREGRMYDSGGAVRWLEKTPKNALRIPFLNTLFPDALFVFLWREPRGNLSSIIDAWRNGGWTTYPQLDDGKGPWSLLLPPGWAEVREKPLEEIAAFQWAATNQHVLDDLAALPKQRWMSLSYAEFLSDPTAAVKRICGFADLDCDEHLLDYSSRPLPLSKHTLAPPSSDKWRRNEALLEQVLPALQPLHRRLADLSPTSESAQ